jgi:hypothetical protein
MSRSGHNGHNRFVHSGVLYIPVHAGTGRSRPNPDRHTDPGRGNIYVGFVLSTKCNFLIGAVLSVENSRYCSTVEAPDHGVRGIYYLDGNLVNGCPLLD